MTIHIEDLADGVHHLQLDATPESLSLPVDECAFSRPIHLDAVLTKTGNNIVIQAKITTAVTFDCSRCLVAFDESFACQVDVLYEKTDRVLSEMEDIDESEDIEVLDHDAKEIHLGRRIEEAIALAMPLKPLCREDCQGLCPSCGTDLNKSTCNCRKESGDPRWQVLKEMIK